MGKALSAITGKAIMSSGGILVAETELPIDYQTHIGNFDAMVLFILATEPYQQVRSIAAD
jgi:hypothetical protein